MSKDDDLKSIESCSSSIFPPCRRCWKTYRGRSWKPQFGWHSSLRKT